MRETDERQENGTEIGRARRAEENERLLRGAGQFLADVRLPGTLHVAFVRSTHAHARLSHVDTSRVMGAPGVMLVLTATDLPMAPEDKTQHSGTDIRARPQPWLARHVVHAVGVPIVAIIADTTAHARDAADLV
ncbi:MAG TPA: xanthine dehydrogenase family protein molybdopterin-binding subunit, partial [Chloroflexota bacterium]|nr:xanthine dehydrogenase family protein molybdopterin-binding subunit [Chloroflexota bacterium]